MAGFFRQTNQELTKEDLVKLGLDPDKAVTKEELTALETRVTQSMTDTIRNSFAELEGKLKPQASSQGDDDRNNNNNNNNNDDRNNNNNDRHELSPVDFMEDPVKHATDIANRSASAVLLSQMNMASDLAWDRATETLPGFRNDTLKAEIETEWKRYPIANRTNPSQLLRNLHDMVMGRHQDEIMQDTAKKEGKFNIIQAGGGSSRQNTTELPQRKPEDSLTQDELRAAASFGMTAKEYADQKVGLKYA